MESAKSRFIKPEFLKPQLSTKLYRSTYHYLRRFFSEKLFDEICQEIGIPKDYILSDGNWVSAEFGASFAELVRKKTQDPEIYRKIGSYYLSAENINGFEYAIIKNMSPFLMLKSIKSITRKWNTLLNVSVERHSLSSATIQMSAKEPVYEDMVFNTLGVVESFKDLYGLNDFSVNWTVDNPKCITNYSLTIKFSAISYYLRRLGNITRYLFGGLAIGFACTELQALARINVTPLFTCIIVLMAFALRQLYSSNKTLKAHTEIFDEKVREKNDEIYHKVELLDRRYHEATLLKTLTQDLVACHDPGTVIDTTLNACRTHFNYTRVAVFTVAKDRGVLELRSSVGFDNFASAFGSIEFKYPNHDAKDGFIAHVLERGLTALIIDIETYKENLRPQNKALLEALQVGSLLICPIQSGPEKFGVMVVVRGAQEQLLNVQDKFLIENIASQLSLYFESASNYSNETKLRHIFQKYVPQPVLEQILSDDYQNAGNLSPTRTFICSVFMDLRGFTSASEELSPEKVFDLINLFSRFATKELAGEGAIIDNIIGDEIVSFFMSKSGDKRDAVLRALRATYRIQESYDSFLQQLLNHGFPKIRLGIGIHCGFASIGSVGSDHKMNFTALGSTVNVASRLQSLSRKISEENVTIIASKDAIDSVINTDVFSFSSEVLRGTAEQTQFIHLNEKTWAPLGLKQENAA